jgi:hypothetical protein
MREKLIELLTDIIGFIGWDNIKDLADYLIENGVVMPVRCQECKYHVANYCTRDIKGRTNAFYMEADDYCSYGIPKEKGEE